MTPEEMRKIAKQSAKAEYDKSIEKLKDAASKGNFSALVGNICDATIEMLREAGYSVNNTKTSGYVPDYRVEIKNK
jgi:hypothetical protein